jgi:predicted AlkP superfamily phosphohydrolase/phosphomutase
VLVVSDHGAELAPATYFQTNDWLRELGLLAPVAARPAASRARALYDLRHLVPKDVRRTARRWLIGSGNERLRGALGRISQGTTALDWSQTAAYWFPVHQQMEGIAINLRGRQPQGIVAPGAEYEALRDRLIGELRALRQPDSDQPLVTEVYRREEVFSGPYTERAPDVLYRLARGYQSHNELDQSRFAAVPPHALERHSAWHDRAGIVVAQGPGVAAGSALEGARLLDIAPTVLAALDLPRAADLDGQPLAAVVGARAATSGADGDALPLRDEGAAMPAGVPAAVSLSDEEEASIKSRLQALGYL